PDEAEKLWRHGLLRALAEGRTSTRQLKAVYFDTDALDLRRRGIELRVRREGRRYIQAVKSKRSAALGLVTRDEDEVVLPDSTPRPALIADPDIRALVEKLQAGDKLRAVFDTDIRRRSRTLTSAGASLLASLDTGAIQAAGRVAPVCELELELLSGAAGDIFDVAAELQKTLSLRISGSGKAAIGYALMTEEIARPKKAGQLDLSDCETLNDAVGMIAAECLDQILANEPVVLAGEDPEGVHQMRVGLRRLRSFFSIMGTAFPEAQVTHFKAELKWLASELGSARDLDVFATSLLAPVGDAFPGDSGLALLGKDTVDARKAAYAQVKATLEGKRYGRLMLDFSRWLAESAWTDQALSSESARLYAPARDFADGLLEKRYRHVLKRGRKATKGSVEDQHALRIEIKKLRYASEFFRSLYSKKKTSRYLRSLAELQEVLGHLNDVAAARDLVWKLTSMHKGGEPQRSIAAGLVIGWHANAADASLQGLSLSWRRLHEAERFWNKPEPSDTA
ncbi:MAG: CYTH and CHAD domain-containing protein, partial [Alphaproteobacteria bacterium]|nr:CYTH and CHAD domain-containing protein [Alphaproteobacteria bacterium]